MKKQIGILKIHKERDIRQNGETACNYAISRIHTGSYPVYYERGMLQVEVKASLIESYYVNRVFSASSIDHEFWKPGERPTSVNWTWGYHDEFYNPFDSADRFAGGIFSLKLFVKVNAELRGHYASGKPIIKYTITTDKSEDGESCGTK